MDDAVGPEQVCQCESLQSTLDECMGNNKRGMQILKQREADIAKCEVAKSNCIIANNKSMQSLSAHEAEIRRMQIALIERDRIITECNTNGDTITSQLHEYQALLRERDQKLSHFLQKGREIETKLNTCTNALAQSQVQLWSSQSQSQSQVQSIDAKMKCGANTLKGGTCNHIANSCPHHYKH